MSSKVTLVMRDARKAPYDEPLLVKTEQGYFVGYKIRGVGWVAKSTTRAMEAIPSPHFYCELPC